MSNNNNSKNNGQYPDNPDAGPMGENTDYGPDSRGEAQFPPAVLNGQNDPRPVHNPGPGGDDKVLQSPRQRLREQARNTGGPKSVKSATWKTGAPAGKSKRKTKKETEKQKTARKTRGTMHGIGTNHYERGRGGPPPPPPPPPGISVSNGANGGGKRNMLSKKSSRKHSKGKKRKTNSKRKAKKGKSKSKGRK